MRCRGQSAIEFLMTYGWAILIIALITLVAYHLGFFDLGGTTAPGISGFWGLIPTDFRFDPSTGHLDLVLTNYVGAEVTFYADGKSCATLESTGVEMCISSGPTLVFKAGDTLQLSSINFPQSDMKQGARFDVLLKLNYTDSRTGQWHLSSGRIWGAYE